MTGAAIAGLGITELGKVYGRSATSLAAEAVRLAVADAGLSLRGEASEPFFAAAARGELLVRRCPRDGAMLGPQARTCPDCGCAELQWAAASGQGTLVSWAVVHQVPVPALAAAVPYLTAVVELAEGPWLMVRLVDTDERGLRAGLPVAARFVPSASDGEATGETLVAFAAQEPRA